MSPAEVRAAKRGDGKQSVAKIGLWPRRQGRWIEIHIAGPDQTSTTISNNPASEHYHRKLFRDLRLTLLHQGCWPYGEDGAEPVSEAPVSRFKPVPIRGKPLSETIIEDRGER